MAKPRLNMAMSVDGFVGLLDEVEVSVSPVLLGAGEQLFANLDGARIALEQQRAIEAPGVTHIK